MTTNFDNNALSSSGGFKPSTVDTPIDIRTRVETENDILSIPNPYIGMIVFVKDTGKRFEVISIKEVQSGLSKVSRVDQYKEFSAHQNLDEYVKKTEIPTKVSELTNDALYTTEDYVTNAIANAQLGGDGSNIDSTRYYTRDEVDEIIKDYTGGIKQVYMTQTEYDSLSDDEKNDNTKAYNITDAVDQIIPVDLDINTNNLLRLIDGTGNAIGNGVIINANTTTGGVEWLDVEEDEIFTSFIDNTPEEYPCTALSYNVSNLTFATNESQSLTLTVEPSNCTDNVNVSIKPEGIVSVADNVVTPLCNGECVINATCGTMTASCTVTVSCFETMYTITNDLTNVDNSNQSVSIAEGASYVATISPKANFELQSCIITMGGVDITDTVYDNGNINIPSVNGNVVITASASMIFNSEGAMLSLVEDGDNMYYEFNTEMYRIKHEAGQLDMFSTLENSYKNDTHAMHSLVEKGVGKTAGVGVTQEGLFSLIPQAVVIASSQSNVLASTTEVSDDQFLVAYHSNNNYALRKPIDDTITATEYVLDRLGETFKIPLSTKPSNMFTVDPNQLSNLTIKTNDENEQYVHITYAANGPSANIYAGLNSLFIYTGSNLNMTTEAPGCACATTTAISIKFFPGTFADLTLEAVKEYLTQNPLIFYRS